MHRPYEPIACSIHDRLEAAATRREVVAIEYNDADGDVERVDDVIADIVVRAGAEYLRLRRGTEIRLDDLLSVNGMPIR